MARETAAARSSSSGARRTCSSMATAAGSVHAGSGSVTMRSQHRGTRVSRRCTWARTSSMVGTEPPSRTMTLHVWPAIVGDSRSRMATSSAVSTFIQSDGLDLLGQPLRGGAHVAADVAEHFRRVTVGVDGFDGLGDLVQALRKPDPRRAPVRKEEAGSVRELEAGAGGDVGAVGTDG